MMRRRLGAAVCGRAGEVRGAGRIRRVRPWHQFSTQAEMRLVSKIRRYGRVPKATYCLPKLMKRKGSFGG